MGPKGVTVDQNGHVIVVDNKACMVFIFQPSGKLVTKFGSRGNGDKQFAGNIIRITQRHVGTRKSCLGQRFLLKAPYK